MPASTPISLPETDAPCLPDWPDRGALALPDVGATDALAARLARVIEPGDTLLLSGQLGAGKTHLARAMIRALLGPGKASEPVPSPTFTLVQTYATPKGEVWHADLYRLGVPGEIPELGLEEAMGSAICLVEWPDRLAPAWPRGAALLHLDRRPDDSRHARLLAAAPTHLSAALAR